jgi:putative FmdB family regulatory protein
MPVYQYICTNCDMEFELKQGFNDESIVKCPRCKKDARRVFAPAPIIFKGSGFYTTDRKNKGNSRGVDHSAIKKMSETFKDTQ